VAIIATSIITIKAETTMKVNKALPDYDSSVGPSYSDAGGASGSGCGSSEHPSTKFKSQHAVVRRWVSYSQQGTMSVPFLHGSYSSISSKFWN